MSYTPYITLKGAPHVMVNALSLTQTYKAANGADAIIEVAGLRTVFLAVDFDANAAGDVVSILPLWSFKQNGAPGATDDEWYLPITPADSITAAVPSETVLSGADFTLQPEFASVTVYPTKIILAAADAGTDEYRIVIPVDVSGARYFTLHACNTAASGGTLNITAVAGA